MATAPPAPNPDDAVLLDGNGEARPSAAEVFDQAVVDHMDMAFRLTLGAFLQSSVDSAVIAATSSFRISANTDPNLSDEETYRIQEAGMDAAIEAVHDSEHIKELMDNIVDRATQLLGAAREYSVAVANRATAPEGYSIEPPQPSRAQRRRRLIKRDADE